MPATISVSQEPSSPIALAQIHSAPTVTRTLSAASSSSPESSTAPTRILTNLRDRTNGALTGTKSRSPTSPISPALPALPLQIIPAGKSYHLSHLTRLPNDDDIRPSTLEGSKTPLRVKHELIIEVRFASPRTDPSGVTSSGVKMMKVAREITISSVSFAHTCSLEIEHLFTHLSLQCCCQLESLLVPLYSELPSTEKVKIPVKQQGKWLDDCVCGSSTERLLAQQRMAGTRLRSGQGNQLGPCPRVKAEYRRTATV